MMTRRSWTTAVVLVGALLVSGTALAGVPANAGHMGRLVSFTSSPNSGNNELMYTVPPKSRLLVTNACVQHNGMSVGVGAEHERLTYGPYGCTGFDPGFVVIGGQSLYCDNRSGLERTCAVSGVLEEAPVRQGPRARFFSLR